MAIEITCPTCGTESYFEELSREARAFCRVCDYPLFWASSARLGAGDAPLGDAGLRRLPGTAGRVAVAMLSCPECTEPNAVTASVCIRCGANLHPAPPMVVLQRPPPPPEPEPLPPPPPPRRVLWPWILLGALAVIAVVVLVVLLA